VIIRFSDSRQSPRPPGRSRRVVATGALAFGLVGSAFGASGLTATAAAATAGSTTSGTSRQIVTLPTGDRVLVADEPGGRQTVALLNVPSGGALRYQTPSGDEYVVPAVAAPFFGTQLDPSLFDVTALAREGATGTRLPVSLSFTAGAKQVAPAGVTLTSSSGTTASGYLTPGHAFTAALHARLAAAAKAGRHPRGEALFAGVSSMRLAGTAAKPASTVHPDFPLYQLQINVNDSTGAPADAVTTVMNTDAITNGNADVPVEDGIGRVELPAGDYAAYTTFFDVDDQGDVTAMRMVGLTDFTVAASTTPTRITVDEADATSLITAATPRPATNDYDSVTWYRLDNSGDSYGVGIITAGAMPLYTNPQSAAKVGSFHYLVQWGGAQPTSDPGYRYDVAFGADTVPADETWVVKPDQLATVTQHFYTDPASEAPGSQNAFMNGALDPVSSASGITFLVGGARGPATPGDLTQYLGTADSGEWAQAFLTQRDMISADNKTFAGDRG
jgi:hypothetical protein